MVSPKKEEQLCVCWRGSGHHFFSLKQDREKLVIAACVDSRQQTSVLLSPGFGPKMGGAVTFWAPHPPGGAAWQVQRFAGMAACCASQKVTVSVFPVTSVVEPCSIFSSLINFLHARFWMTFNQSLFFFSCNGSRWICGPKGSILRSFQEPQKPKKETP
jgi:hypothetical protein